MDRHERRSNRRQHPDVRWSDHRATSEREAADSQVFAARDSGAAGTRRLTALRHRSCARPDAGIGSPPILCRSVNAVVVGDHVDADVHGHRRSRIGCFRMRQNAALLSSGSDFAVSLCLSAFSPWATKVGEHVLGLHVSMGGAPMISLRIVSSPV